MLRSIGLLGGLGAILALGGVGVIAYVDPLLAAGLLAILIGVSLVVKDLISSALSAFGLNGFV